MSDRPTDQSLTEPIDKILKGFDEFEQATKKRIESKEWQDGHIQKLNNFRKQLIKLQEETW